MRRLGSALWRRPSVRVPALAPLRRRRRRRRGAPSRLSGFTLGLSLRETQTAAFRESGGQAEAAPAQLRRSPQEDQGAGREGKARSPILSPWGSTEPTGSSAAARDPLPGHFAGCARTWGRSSGRAGAGDGGGGEGDAHRDGRGVSGGLGGGGGRSRGYLPASPLRRQHRLPGPRPPGRVLCAFPGPEPAHDAPGCVLIAAAPPPPTR